MTKTRSSTIPMDSQGPAPPMQDCDNVTMPEVKVKRKCGRPRNPIPRHQRPSHIASEQKRRGKIMKGFQLMRSLLPKDYQTDGRESKADVLHSTVRFMVDTKDEVEKQLEELAKLKKEKAEYKAAITAYQQNLPDEKLFDENPLSSAERYDRLVKERTKDNSAFSLFGFLAKPLHQEFEQMADCSTSESFRDTTWAWAHENLSLSKLRPMMTTRMSDLSTEQSLDFIKESTTAPKDALQSCRQGLKIKTAAQPATSVDDTCPDRPARKPQRNSRGVSKPGRPATSKRGKKSKAEARMEVPSSAAVTDPASQLALPSPPAFSELAQGLDVSLEARLAWLPAADAVKHERTSNALPSCSFQSTGPSYRASCLEGAPDPLKVESSLWDISQGSPAHARPPSQAVADSPLGANGDSALALSPNSSYQSSLFGEDFLNDQHLDVPTSFSECNDFLLGQRSSPPQVPRDEAVDQIAGTFDMSAYPTIMDGCPLLEHNDSGPSDVNTAVSAQVPMGMFTDVVSSLFNLPSSQPVNVGPLDTGAASFAGVLTPSAGHLAANPYPTSTEPALPGFMNLGSYSSTRQMNPPCSITGNSASSSFMGTVSSSSSSSFPSSSTTASAPLPLPLPLPSSSSASHMDSRMINDTPFFSSTMSFSSDPSTHLASSLTSSSGDNPNPYAMGSPPASNAEPSGDHLAALPDDVDDFQFLDSDLVDMDSVIPSDWFNLDTTLLDISELVPGVV